jgi:hypothetical protein
VIRFVLSLLPWWVWALLLTGLATWAGSSIYLAGANGVRAKWNAEKLAQHEQRRNQERRDAETQRKIDDELTDALVAGADLAHAADQRLRELSRTYRAAHPAAAKCGNDAPAAAVLREQDRVDLVALAREANDIVAQLTACQQREVMRGR